MIPDRILNKIDRTGGLDACHPWRGGRGNWGRGVVWYGGRYYAPARLVWMLTHGVVLPATTYVLHSCDNMQDAVRKGRQARGASLSRRRSRKLTEDAVRALRADHARGVGPKKLGELYGISAPQASMIARGLRWRHVKMLEVAGDR